MGWLPAPPQRNTTQPGLVRKEAATARAGWVTSRQRGLAAVRGPTPLARLPGYMDGCRPGGAPRGPIAAAVPRLARFLGGPAPSAGRFAAYEPHLANVWPSRLQLPLIPPRLPLVFHPPSRRAKKKKAGEEPVLQPSTLATTSPPELAPRPLPGGSACGTLGATLPDIGQGEVAVGGARTTRKANLVLRAPDSLPVTRGPPAPVAALRPLNCADPSWPRGVSGPLERRPVAARRELPPDEPSPRCARPQEHRTLHLS